MLGDHEEGIGSKPGVNLDEEMLIHFLEDNLDDGRKGRYLPFT